MIGSIQVRDINLALMQALPLLAEHGKPVTAASVANARPTIEWPGVFVTEYTNPMRNVLFDDKRDANPFFHYLEAMWIIAGRDDVDTLARVLPRMAEYSDDGKTFHGAYGHRLRNHFRYDCSRIDQIEEAIAILKSKPESRQVVMSIWDPATDLGAVTRDMPCNDMVMCKIRNGKLNITVNNRSNDVVLGCYGANVVQFSMLQMYMAAQIGCGVGTYTQVSDSFHVYEDNPYWQEFKQRYDSDRIEYLLETTRHRSVYDKLGENNLFTNGIELFDAEIKDFWRNLGQAGLGHVISSHYLCPAVRDAAFMWNALVSYRNKDFTSCQKLVDQVTASDWQYGATLWLRRREEKRNADRREMKKELRNV